MRALRRWTRKAKCRRKYGKACPHGGHYGGKRRNRMSAIQTHAQTHPIEEPDERKEHQAGAHKATKRSTAAARADA